MRRSQSNSFQSLFSLWLTLLSIWLVVNASLAVDVIVVGVLVATILAIPLASFAGAYADIRLTPKALMHYILYLGVFLWELVLANLNLARIVFSPKIDIHPGIVKVRTRLQSRTGRLVLANSITLTPGTLVVDIDDDVLYVHWIDVTTQDSEQATREIAAKFEKYLEVIYG
ncbi:MAG: Na+/H+ antiporter subunit E [Pseudomonadota bacterium]